MKRLNRSQTSSPKDLPERYASLWKRMPRSPSFDNLPVTGLPQRKELKVHAGVLRTAFRLVLCACALCWFAFRMVVDWLLRRDAPSRRAVHLREILEGLGATFTKIGQQMAIRSDLLPIEYTTELEKLLDKTPAFDLSAAIPAIEKATGKSMDEVFSSFDPIPIGTGSVACVYQAELAGGARVAVKVRRPGIVEVFAADMRAIEWILKVAEVYLIPPEFSRNLIFELRTMLFEELDFRREERYLELFRRQARQSGLKYVRAPRTYPTLSSDEVLVTEFVAGLSMSDVLRIIESDDHAAMAQLEEQRINPKKLARRLTEVTWFSGQEGWFFHADLHSANIIVRPKSRLVFIDFGSCGAFTERERHIWRQLLNRQSVEDVGGMVQATIALLEPLPRIDVDEFSGRLEAIFWRDLYAIQSKQSAWWERTSANIWLDVFRLAREYRIPMNLNTLRMIRSTMLADSLAARLDHRLDHYKEFRRYQRKAGIRAGLRLQAQFERLSRPEVMVHLEQMYEGVSNGLYRVQRLIDTAEHRFKRQSSNAAYIISNTLRMFYSQLVITLLWASFAQAKMLFTSEDDHTLLSSLKDQMSSLTNWIEILSNPWYLAVMFFVVLATMRRIWYRLDGTRAVE